MKNNSWVKMIGASQSIRATAVLMGTELEQSCLIHHYKLLHEKKAFAESILAALLMASRMKGSEQLSLSIHSSGKIKQSVIDASPQGHFRGFLVPNSDATQEASSLGPWETGYISLMRSLGNNFEPYVGTCELTTGHLAKDLAVYLQQSEQVNAAVGIHVLQTAEGLKGGAFLIEALPEASDEITKTLQRKLLHFKDFESVVAQANQPLDLTIPFLAELSLSLLEEKPVSFQCSCDRTRVEKALTLVGFQELNEMKNQDHGASVHCDFCNTKYEFSEEQLSQLIQNLS